MCPTNTGDGDLSSQDQGTRELHWPTEWPADFKRFMCWIFAITSLQHLTISLRNILFASQRDYTLPYVHLLLMPPVFPSLVAITCGVAWWTVWKEKPLARVWALAASLMYVLIFLRQFIIPMRPIWGHHAGSLFIGIAGLAAFLWPDKKINL